MLINALTIFTILSHLKADHLMKKVHNSVIKYRNTHLLQLCTVFCTNPDSKNLKT